MRRRNCLIPRVAGFITAITGLGPQRAKVARRRKTFLPMSKRAANSRAVCTLSASSKDKKDFTPDSLIAAAYDSYLPWFDRTIPALIKAWDSSPDEKLAEQIRLLRNWNLRWAVDSIPTTLAIFWARKSAARALMPARMPPEQLLSALSTASNKLTADFGKWQTPWGEINRFQRLTGDIVQPFSDNAPSIPVGFVSGNWGSLASFGAHAYPGTRNGTALAATVSLLSWSWGKRSRPRCHRRRRKRPSWF